MVILSHFMIFTLLSLFSILILLYSQSFLLIWMSLEISLFSSFLLLINKSSKTKTLGASQIYFLSQAIGSLLVLLSSVWHFKPLLVSFGLAIKLGLFPFSFWFPFLIYILDFFYLFFFLTLKKLLTLWFLVNFVEIKIVLVTFALTSMMFGVFMMLSELKDVKLFLSWSSLTDSGFLTLLGLFSMFKFWVYFLCYSLTMLFFCLSSGQTTTIVSTKFNFLKSSNFSFALFFFIFLGLPPFFSFFYKIMFFTDLLSGFSSGKLVTSFSFPYVMIMFSFLQSLSYFMILTKGFSSMLNLFIVSKSLYFIIFFLMIPIFLIVV